MEDLTTIGRINFRRDTRFFGISQDDRLHHMYIIGKTGTGKSTLLKTMIREDIQSGRGCALLDPHGDMVEEVVESLSEKDMDRLVYLNVPDPDLEWGYNPLAYVSLERRPLLASGVMEILKKQWDGRSWGVRMEHLLRNVLLTLLEQPQATIADVLTLFTDKTFRAKALSNVKNEHVRNFWEKEFDKYSYRVKIEAVIPIQNKLGGFLSNPTLARILITNTKKIRLRSVMDDGKILLVNLAKGQIGEDAANLLGGLLLTSLGLAAYTRNDTPENKRRPFHIYADEFHNFATLSTASMLSEMRKYSVSFTLANQYLYQLDQNIREAVMGNTGSLISFRVGAKDARVIAEELNGKFTSDDLLNLPNYSFYMRQMIDGLPSRGFSGSTVQVHSRSLDKIGINHILHE